MVENENTETNEIIEDNYSQFSKISEITLEYLMNKRDYKKYQNIKSINAAKNISKDKIFYQKRINDMTRYFMSHKATNEEDRYYPDYLVNAFDNYLETMIEYFKTIDKTDILQEDYIGLHSLEEIEDEVKDELENEDSFNSISLTAEDKYKSLFLKQPTTPTLFNNFMKVNKNKPEEINQFPLQKEIQLDNPILKTKGVSYHKNNNITNKYEKTHDKDTKIAKTNAELCVRRDPVQDTNQNQN